MSQECGFFNAQMVGGEYDRVYLAEQFAAYFAAFIGNGIYGKSMQKLQVLCQDVPNMSIKVLSGEAFINGWWYRNTDTYNLQIPIADGVLSRIDVVVLRWGNTERDMWLHLITGTPSANPVKPSIRRDADYYDLQLAVVNVSAGSIKITQAQIQDTRLDNDVCGLVTGVVDQIDTTDLYNQFEAYFQNFKEVNEADFEFWFNNIKTQLSGDVAASLQLQIYDLIEDADKLQAQIGNLKDLTTEKKNNLTEAVNELKQSLSDLENLDSGVSGVKGDKETQYRKGDVNLTPANIGAISTNNIDINVNGSTGKSDIRVPSTKAVWKIFKSISYRVKQPYTIEQGIGYITIDLSSEYVEEFKGYMLVGSFIYSTNFVGYVLRSVLEMSDRVSLSIMTICKTNLTSEYPNITLLLKALN